VAVDRSGRLFVSDSEQHALICFNPAGEPIAHFGMGDLSRPGGIALDKQRNRLYVADSKDSRIAVFDTNTFRLLQHYGAPSKPGKPESVGIYRINFKRFFVKYLCPFNISAAMQRQRGFFIYYNDTLKNMSQPQLYEFSHCC